MTKADRIRLRKALNQTEKVLLRGGPVAEAYWNIMSALRGPDGQNNTVKQKAYTVKVRRRAFPKLARVRRHNVPADMDYHYCEAPGKIGELDRDIDCSNHFRSHIKSAFKGLGIQ